MALEDGVRPAYLELREGRALGWTSFSQPLLRGAWPRPVELSSGPVRRRGSSGIAGDGGSGKLRAVGGKKPLTSGIAAHIWRSTGGTRPFGPARLRLLTIGNPVAPVQGEGDASAL